MSGGPGIPGKRVPYHAEEGLNQEIELKQQKRSMEGRVMANPKKRDNAIAMCVHVRNILLNM